VNLALHDARLASADFADFGKGYWHLPTPAPFTSGASVIAGDKSHRATKSVSASRPVNGGRLPRTKAPSTSRELFLEPFTPPATARGALGVCSFDGPNGLELDSVPTPGQRVGLGVGHLRLTSATVIST